MASRTPVRAVTRGRCLLENRFLLSRPSSSSTVQRKQMPEIVAPQTAPSELLTLIDDIRTKIFAPTYLRTPQKRLIYRKKFWNMLRNEPITIEMAGKPHRLVPVDRTKDIPDSWKSMTRAMDLMGEDAATWRGTWVGLLKGFKAAGKRWSHLQMEYLLRKAAKKGMVGVVVDAARVGPESGVVLGDVRLVREALWGCRTLAFGDEDRGEKERALRYAEAIAVMCETEDHAMKEYRIERDPRVQPDCIGLLLELAALNQQKDKVQRYAQMLIHNLELGLGQGLDEPEEALKKDGKVAAAADYELMRWVPVVGGLEGAQKLLKESMPKAELAASHLEKLRHRVEIAKEEIASSSDPKKNDRPGFVWYHDWSST